MSATNPRRSIKGLRKLVDLRGMTGLVPFPDGLADDVFRARRMSGQPGKVMEVARSLGAELGELQDCREEPDLYWIRFRGQVHGITVDVTADGCASPALPFGEVTR